MSYDPNSSDSMFSRVLTRLDEQDRNTSKTNAEFLLILNDIRSEARRTNGRVTKLETAQEVGKAKIAVLATAVSAAVGVAGWAANTLLGK